MRAKTWGTIALVGILLVLVLDTVRHFTPNTPPPNAPFQPIGMNHHSAIRRR